MTTSPLTLESLIQLVMTHDELDQVLDRLERAVTLADRLGELAENLVGHFVDESRRSGASWAEIGGRLGVTRQAVQKRFVVADAGSARFWDRTSKQFSATIKLAEFAARARHQTFLGTEHVLLALCEQPRDPATAILASVGIDSRVLRGAVNGRIGSPTDVPGTSDVPLTAKMLRALQLAKREALKMDTERIETVHLLLALLALKEGMANEILLNLGATYENVLEAVHVSSQRP